MFVYVVELNRCRGDNVLLAAQRFTRRGINASVIRQHKTTLRLERPKGMTWQAFKAEVRRELQPRQGSALVHSHRSGRTYVCSNSGNRSGRFDRIS